MQLMLNCQKYFYTIIPLSNWRTISYYVFLLSILDLVHLMTYDFFGGSWAASTDHNSPMFASVHYNDTEDLFNVVSSFHADKFFKPKDDFL